MGGIVKQPIAKHALRKTPMRSVAPPGAVVRIIEIRFAYTNL
jgi:hypothetical protein